MATQSGWQTFTVLFRQSQVLYVAWYNIIRMGMLDEGGTKMVSCRCETKSQACASPLTGKCLYALLGEVLHGEQ